MTRSPSNAGPAPTLDLDDFRRRSHAIWQARERAIEEREVYSQEEADADRDYQLLRSKALLKWRGEGASWSAAEKLAEGDAAPLKWKRESARGLKRSCEFRLEALERNAANLRKEADMSDQI